MEVTCTTCGVWQKCMEEDYEENPTRPLCCRYHVNIALKENVKYWECQV